LIGTFVSEEDVIIIPNESFIAKIPSLIETELETQRMTRVGVVSLVEMQEAEYGHKQLR